MERTHDFAHPAAVAKLRISADDHLAFLLFADRFTLLVRIEPIFNDFHPHRFNRHSRGLPETGWPGICFLELSKRVAIFRE
jgi:hypothetical protein